MATEAQSPRARSAEEVTAARRAAMLRFAVQQQEAGHHAEAQDMYRQLIEEYPDTAEGSEAREQLLDRAFLFESQKQPYRMLSLYNTLESMYAPASSERVAEARRARVKAILEEINQQKQQEAEAQARLEAIREGVERAPEPATTAPQRQKPAHGARKRATRRQGARGVA